MAWLAAAWVVGTTGSVWAAEAGSAAQSVESVGDAVSWAALVARPADPARAEHRLDPARPRPARNRAERPRPRKDAVAGTATAAVPARRVVPGRAGALSESHGGRGGVGTVSSLATGVRLASAEPPSPPASASFLAALDNGAANVYSPDIGGAVGPNHLMVALATEVVIQDRAGTVVSSMPLDAFWAGVTTPSPAVYEPRLAYDTYYQRWLFVAAANYTNNPGLLVAVSQGADPTQGWYRRFIATDTPRSVYAVAPTVGFSDNRMVVQANMFFTTNHGFFGSYIYAFTKTNLYAGGSGSPRRFELLAFNAADPDFSQGSEENAPVPAVTYDSGVTTNYFVGNLNGDDESFGWIRIYSLGGPLGSETFRIATATDPVALPAWAHYAPTAAFLPQAGTTNKLDAGDCRMQTVVLQNARLWAVQTVFYPSDAPTYCGLQWWDVTPGGFVRQVVTIEDPSVNEFYAYPSLAVNDASEVLVGYSRFTWWTYPSAFYAFQGFNDTDMYIRPGALLKAGEAPYEKKHRNGSIYWGQWSAATLDPNNLIDLWTVQPYAATPVGDTNRWGAWWGRISPPVDLQLTLRASVSQAIQQSNFTYTLTVTNANFGLPASGVRLTNTLPAGVTFVSVTSSQGNCTHSNGIVGCRLGQLGLTNMATVTITVVPTVVGQILNTAFVVANGPDDQPANNTASLALQVLPAADLAVSGEVAPNPVNLGQTTTWTVSVSNLSSSAASAVTLSNTLPTALVYVSATPSQGSCAVSGQTVTCSLGVVPGLGAASVAIVARANATGVTVTNRATARTTTLDVNPANNTTATPLRLNAPPALGAIAPQSINEDSGALVLPFAVSDPETPAANLVLSASSSAQALVPNSNLVLGGSGTSRTLTITPLPDAFGVTTITRVLTDTDGASVTNTFQLTVNPVNDPPTLNPMAKVVVDEDPGLLTVPLTGLSAGPANEPQTLTITAASSDTNIVPHPLVSYSGGSTGLLSFTPLTHAFGSPTITVTVNDGGASNNTVVRTFTVQINPVNDPPRLAAISDLTIDEDAGLQTVNLTGITSGAYNETDTLTLSVSNSNPALLTNFALSYSSPNPTGTLTFGTVSNAFGTALVTVTVNDNRGSNNLTSRTFAVTVNAVNDRPTLDPIASLTLDEDAPPQIVPLTGISVGAPNENQTLTLTVTNLNANLVTNIALNYTSPETTGTLTFSLVPHASGTATIWVAANDGDSVNFIRNRTFTVTVNPVNDPPTIDPVPALTLLEDAGPQTLILTGISAGPPDEPQTLTITSTSSNTALIPNPVVTYTSPSNWAVLTFTPVADASGTATLNVRLNDGGASNNVTRISFDVTVVPVNDPPTLNPIANIVTNENAGQLTVPLTGLGTGAPNEPDLLSLSVSNSRPDLLTNFVLSYTSPNPTGSLTFRTVPNAFGTAVVTVTVNDGAPSNNLIVRAFTVHLIEINDPPTLDPLPDRVMDEDGPPLIVPLSGITSGAANELQTLTVTATSSQPALIPNPVPVTYTSPATSGSLTLAPLPDAFGVTLITVTVNDGGASNNLVTRAFTLTVRPVNDLPIISAIEPQVTAEDTSLTLAVVIGDKETPAGSLILQGASSNEELVVPEDIRFSGSGSNRWVTLTPLTNQFGEATIFITVLDADGGSATASFELQVNPVNDPPYLSSIADLTINRDTSTPNLPFTVQDVDSLPQAISLSARSSNPALVPDSNIVLSGTGVNRTVRITPVAGGTGSATITLVATDGLATNTTSFALVVNGPPTLSTLPDRAIQEDTATGPLAFTIGDVETPAANLTVTAHSSNTNVVAPGGLVLGGSGSNRTINVTPLFNQFGQTLITLIVTDPHGLAASNSFSLTVLPVNDPPSLSTLANQTMAESGVLGPLAFTVGDVETSASLLLLSAHSSEPSLLPDAGITLGGSGSNRTVTVRPVPGRSGSTTVTLFVADTEGGVSSRAFLVTVNPVNDPPTLTPPPNVAILEDASTGPLPFVVGDPDTPLASLTVTATSSNPTLVPNANIVLSGTGPDRTLTATPATNQFGTTTITVTVSDGSGASTNASFTLTVNPVNDPPTLNALNNLTLNEDAGLQTVSLAGISTGAPNEGQTLTITATSSQPAVVPHPTVTYTSPNPTGTLTFTPVANAFGTATITVTVNDNAPSNNLVVRVFTVTIVPVNDPPTISDMPNQTTPEGTPLVVPFTIGDWETPAYALTLSAASTNTALVQNNRLSFEGTGAERSLIMVPNPFVSGTTLITVTVSDGTNTASDTFVLTVTATNDPPTLDPILDVAAVANANTTIALSGITSGATNESQTLTLTVTNDNPTLFATQPAINYTSPNPTATLTCKPASGKIGSARITVTVRDNGTPPQSVSRTFTLYSRLSANTVPTISAIPTQTIQEGASAGPIAFTIGDATTPATLLTVSATASNLTLVPTNGFTFGGSGSNRTVTVTPAPYQFGTNIITIGVLDTNGGYNRTNFLLIVNPVNDRPQISPIANVTIPEDTSTGLIPFTVSDAETRATALTVTAASSNPTLVPQAKIVTGGSGTNRALVITPAPDQFGTAIITVTVSDGVNTNATTFTLTVTPVNDPPAVSDVADVVLNEDTTAGPFPFTIGDLETAPGSLTLSATSSNPSLLPVSGITFGGSGSNRTVSFTPLPNQFGTATVTLTVTDGHGASASDLVHVTVLPVNDPPTLAVLPALSVNQNAGLQAVALAGIGSGAANENQPLYVTASSSNPALIPTPTVNYTSPNSTGTLTFRPLTNASGTATITVTVSDGQPANSTVSRAFTVTVNAPPTLSIIPPQIIDEDTPTADLAFTVSDDATPVGALTFTGVSSDPALVANSGIVFGGSGANRTVRVTPVTNAFGLATLTVTATDAQGASSSRSFSLRVNPVNDPPTLAALGNLVIAEDSGLQTVTLTGISAGAANESQPLTVTATSSNPALIPTPTVNYTSPNATGTLSFAPLADAFGTATITVTVSDGQATNATVTRSFTVTVNPVNDPPTLAALSPLTLDEDSGPRVVALTGISAGPPNENQPLTVTATSSAPAIIPHPTVSYVSPSATGSLSFTPLPNAFGTATISVTVSDGQATNATVTRTFTVTVNPVNDPPTLDPIGDRVVQGGGLQTVALTGLSGGPANEPQTLQVTAVSSNTALIPHPAVRYTSPNATGTLEFTPVTGATGSVTLAVVVNDGAPSNNLVVRTFTVTVLELPVEPRLRIVLEPDGRVAVFWPAALTSYLLQAREAFALNSPWIPVSGTPQRVGNEFKLTLPPGGPSRFFRLALAAPSPLPRLALRRLDDGRLALAWPANSTGMVLEAREALRPETAWTAVPETPERAGDEWRVILAPTGPARFFRLRE